jgi:hypothetical protein
MVLVIISMTLMYYFIYIFNTNNNEIEYLKKIKESCENAETVEELDSLYIEARNYVVSVFSNKGVKYFKENITVVFKKKLLELRIKKSI